MDSPAGLEEKADKERCELCRLLAHSIQAWVKVRHNFVRFARVGSYLTIDDSQGQAVTNFYTMPGMCRAQLRLSFSPRLLTVDQVPKRPACRAFKLGFLDYLMLAARPSSRS